LRLETNHLPSPKWDGGFPFVHCSTLLDPVNRAGSGPSLRLRSLSSTKEEADL
jgi:hypothetical protein